MDRAHPLTEATDGQFNVTLMNQIHYDGVTIGNNEGLGNSKEQLIHLYDHANFDVILGNLLNAPKIMQPMGVARKSDQDKGGTGIVSIRINCSLYADISFAGWEPILRSGCCHIC